MSQFSKSRYRRKPQKTPYRVKGWRDRNTGKTYWVAWNTHSMRTTRPPNGQPVATMWDGRAVWGCKGRTPFEASQRYRAWEACP